MNRSSRRVTSLIVFVVSILGSAFCSRAFVKGEPGRSSQSDRLVIHEWGTFTCLQDETGQAITGVNTDDEPVPAFVHRISDLIPKPSELAPVYYKGVPRSHQQVRMRLETSVVYFHPPADLREPFRVSLQVDFRGGWLTEYYPAAHVSAPGLNGGNFRFSGLTPQTRGSLEWHDLAVGGDSALPNTDAQVWLAPRAVDAATVKTPGGEAERYLFYRGVGNLPAPLTVTRNEKNDELIVREDVPAILGLRGQLPIRGLWLVHVRDDGLIAYRALGSTVLKGESGRELLRTPVSFERATPRDAQSSPAAGGTRSRLESVLEGYSGGNFARLRSEMRESLIADGLFRDEADAMLKTWELAYFKSPGLRLFFLLPQEWTNAVLPMKCSMDAELSRTMVGRIEIVTPRQRSLIQQISQGNVSRVNWLYEQEGGRRNAEIASLWEGRVRFQDLKIAVPREYQSYLDLGRFRNALILDDFHRNPHSGIGRFVEAYHLGYYTPDD